MTKIHLEPFGAEMVDGGYLDIWCERPVTLIENWLDFYPIISIHLYFPGLVWGNAIIFARFRFFFPSLEFFFHAFSFFYIDEMKRKMCGLFFGKTHNKNNFKLLSKKCTHAYFFLYIAWERKAGIVLYEPLV